MRKKLRQLSTTHWCRVVLGFHGVALRFRRPNLQVQVLGWFPNGEPAGPIDEPCAMKPPNFGATAWHADCIDMFSAKMRSSTRRTTRSLASWSNFLGMFQIFPSTQTEQNLGHFNSGGTGPGQSQPYPGGYTSIMIVSIT